MRKPKYIFNKSLKKDFLKGHSMVYLSTVAPISYSYLAGIMTSKYAVDDCIVEIIMTHLGYNNKEIDKLRDFYFSKNK